MVFGDHRIDRDRHIGDRAGEQFLAHPLAAVDRVGLQVQRVGDQPGRVREHAFAIGDLRRLGRGIIPVRVVDVEEPAHVLAPHLRAGPRRRLALVPVSQRDAVIRRGRCLAFAEAEGVAGHQRFE